MMRKATKGRNVNVSRRRSRGALVKAVGASVLQYVERRGDYGQELAEPGFDASETSLSSSCEGGVCEVSVDFYQRRKAMKRSLDRASVSHESDRDADSSTTPI